MKLQKYLMLKFNTTEELIHYGNKLKEMGAQNVLISMGGDGAIFNCREWKVYRSNVPKGSS